MFELISDSFSDDLEAASLDAAKDAIEDIPEVPEGEEEEVRDEEAAEEEEEDKGEETEAEGGEGDAETLAEGDEVSHIDAEDTVSRAGGGKPKKLTNQFNFCERAALTYNNPTRVKQYNNVVFNTLIAFLLATRNTNNTTTNGDV